MRDYQWLKEHLTSIKNGGFTTAEMMEWAIQALDDAILAEREACAKICEEARLKLFRGRREYTNSREYRIQADCINEIAQQIRARSNPAPQIENKPLESPKIEYLYPDAHY